MIQDNNALKRYFEHIKVLADKYLEDYDVNRVVTACKRLEALSIPMIK